MLHPISLTKPLNKVLRYRDYNPTWKKEFQKLYHHLDAILTTLVVDIVHIGSTSVESLGAKPILDIACIFEDNLTLIIAILEQNNYRYEGEKGIKDRHAFRYLKDDFYEHHLYVTKNNSRQIKENLLFKRALQNNPHFRQEYMTLKKQLIAENKTNRSLYTNRKTEFITRILKEESIMKSIILGGGCFWGVEAYFKQLDGVTHTEVGYIGGEGETTYQEVCAGSGHAEAVLLKYDEDIISIKKILDHFFNIIDPTSLNKQGPDVGIQYRTGIYNYTPEQQPFIENYISVRQKEYTRPIQVERLTNLTFYPAEEYHQDYLDKNKNGYCHVNLASYKNVK